MDREQQGKVVSKNRAHPCDPDEKEKVMGKHRNELWLHEIICFQLRTAWLLPTLSIETSGEGDAGNV